MNLLSCITATSGRPSRPQRWVHCSHGCARQTKKKKKTSKDQTFYLFSTQFKPPAFRTVRGSKGSYSCSRLMLKACFRALLIRMDACRSKSKQSCNTQCGAIDVISPGTCACHLRCRIGNPPPCALLYQSTATRPPSVKVSGGWRQRQVNRKSYYGDGAAVD